MPEPPAYATSAVEVFRLPAGERFPIKLEGTVDRRDFGIDWNMELPNGEQALSYDVALTADLFLVKG